ncbi:MAG: xylulokinase [Pirellulales bacterium]|nr:xylulokinase [Pirellulales bacterium]
MSCYLGIDLGTSGAKALLMDTAGKILATASAEHPIAAPRPGWSEQKPDDWWRSATQAVRRALHRAKVDPADVAAIGLSGQMHGLVLTDGDGEVLRPAILWNDQRTAREAAEIERAVGGRRNLVKMVGNAAMTSFTLTKLLWVRRHEPRVYERARHLLLPKDYLRLRLTGEYVGDVSDMSGTLMLDQEKRDWSGPILEKFRIDRELLPPVVESHEITGRLTKPAARQLGLKPGVPVVGGGGDQPVGAVGNGIVAPGLASATLGTSGVMYVHSREYRADPESRVNTFCSCVAGQWCLFGCVLSAGGSLQWFRNTLAQSEMQQARREKRDPYELLTAQAAEAPLGAGGVFFLPYLTGERTPYADPFARGGWIGLQAGTTRGQLIRAVLEGVTFAMNDALQLLKAAGVRIRQIRLSGGGARSPIWRQMQADVYGAPCAVVNADEGPAYGAAILAAVGAGEFRSVAQACKALVQVAETIQPGRAARARYADYYRQFTRLYPALSDEFPRLQALTENGR